MRISKRNLMQALLSALDGKDDRAAGEIISGFVRRFGPRLGAEALSRMAEELPSAYLKSAGIEEVTVETARPIDAKTAEAAAAACGADPKASAVSVSVRPELIGGFRSRRPDRILDASVRCRLERARRALAG